MTPPTHLIDALADRYRLERELGAGGMATVYLAHDLKHDRDVAIKVLHPDLGAALGGERFLSEIRTTARLQHPHILPLLDSGDAGHGLLYYVMPLATGETLRDRLSREKQLPIDDALRIAREVADALGHAHSQGIIHRDIKPENILLQGGHAMVADFGIALAVTAASGSRMTQTGLSLGTPQYMSPEQAMGERTIDARSDVYALGAVTYEMLVGDPPFTGSTVQAIVARVLTERPTQLTSVRDTVPRHVEATVLKALAKLPADRFSSATEFAHALQHASDTAALTASQSTDSAATRASAASSRRLVALLAVATLVSTGAALWAWLRPAPPMRRAQLTLSLPDSQRVMSQLGRLALSRDGSQLAYVGTHTNTTVIFVRALDDTIPRRVRGTEGAYGVTWSPSGTELLFPVPSRGMFTIGIMGGTAARFGEPGTPSDWGLGGSILYTQAQSGAIWRTTRNGEPTLVARPDSTRPVAYEGATFLPGDKAAVFTIAARDRGMAPGTVGVVTLDDGAVTRLDIEGRAIAYANGFLLVAQSGTIVAYPFSPSRRAVTGPPIPVVEQVQQSRLGAAATVSDDGTLVFASGAYGRVITLVAVDRAGKERSLAVEPRLFSWPRVSPDGRRVAVEIGSQTGGFDVWVLDVASRALSRLTSNGSGIRPLGWSRDGRDIGFLALGERRIATLDADRRITWIPWDLSGPSRSLHVESKERIEDASVSPVGDLIAVRVLGYGAPGDILTAPVDSPRVAKPFVATQADEETPRFSPDGRLLAYASNETGDFEVYVRPASGTGGRVQVSVGGGAEPVWAHDGSGLYYRSPSHMMFAALNARAEVVRRDTLFADVFRKEIRAISYDVFPGGQQFLMQRFVTAGSGDLNVILNWPELARRRAAAQTVAR